MTMDKLLPYLITSACSLAVGYLLGYLNHGLAVRREAESRRRKFRDSLRVIVTHVDASNHLTFFKTYQDTVPIVKEECAQIYEDVRLWRRNSFEAGRDKYCSFKQYDLELRRPPSAVGMQEYGAQNKAKREESKAMLRRVLDQIGKAAR